MGTVDSAARVSVGQAHSRASYGSRTSSVMVAVTPGAKV